MKSANNRRKLRNGRGRGTWRTNQGFGASFVVAPATPTSLIVAGTKPTTAVAAGMPEPITEYELTAVQGGIEIGLGSILATDTYAVTNIGFGLYKVDWDDVIPGFPTQDPLSNSDVCRDNWLHLDWQAFIKTGVAVNTDSLVQPFDSQPMRPRLFRFSAGSIRLREGQALMAVLTVDPQGPSGGLTVTPYFRYHLRVVA